MPKEPALAQLKKTHGTSGIRRLQSGLHGLIVRQKQLIVQKPDKTEG